MKKLYGSFAAALALAALLAQGAFAFDVSSQITAMGTSTVTDLSPNLVAAIGVGITIFGILFAAGLIWPALRQAKKGKSGG